MIKKVTSKKLWVFVATATATTAAAYTGQLAWPIAVNALTTQLLVYLGAEGSVDIARTIGDAVAKIVEAKKGKEK